MNFEDDLSYCFEFINTDNGSKLIDYLMFYFGIKVYIINYDDISNDNIITGYKIIAVEKKYYETAIDKGIDFLTKNNINDILWLDAGGFLRKNNTFEIAEMQVPMNRKVKPLWGIEKNMPTDLKYYLRYLDDYLGVKTFRECDDFTNSIYLSADKDKYEECSRKLEEHIELYGYGPFEKIIPLTKYGEYKIKKLSK